jgi:hypothetical protein
MAPSKRPASTSNLPTVSKKPKRSTRCSRLYDVPTDEEDTIIVDDPVKVRSTAGNTPNSAPRHRKDLNKRGAVVVLSPAPSDENNEKESRAQSNFSEEAAMESPLADVGASRIADETELSDGSAAKTDEDSELSFNSADDKQASPTVKQVAFRTVGNERVPEFEKELCAIADNLKAIAAKQRGTDADVQSWKYKAEAAEREKAVLKEDLETTRKELEASNKKVEEHSKFMEIARVYLIPGSAAERGERKDKGETELVQETPSHSPSAL